MYNHNIERWWSHLGLFDRCQICGFPYDDYAPEVLTETDEWWDNLSYEEKKRLLMWGNKSSFEYLNLYFGTEVAYTIYVI